MEPARSARICAGGETVKSSQRMSRKAWSTNKSNFCLSPPWRGFCLKLLKQGGTTSENSSLFLNLVLGMKTSFFVGKKGYGVTVAQLPLPHREVRDPELLRDFHRSVG